MSVSTMYFGLSQSKNISQMRSQIEEFIKDNYNFTGYEDEGDTICISSFGEITVNNETYKLMNGFDIIFDSEAYSCFYVNFPGFRNKKIITDKGTNFEPNFLFYLNCNYSDLGIQKFSWDLMKKLIEITDGYLGVFELEKSIVEKYKDEILIIIDEDEIDHYNELFLLNSKLIDKISSLEQDLIKLLRNQVGYID